MIVPNAALFNDRRGDWLEQLRAIRENVKSRVSRSPRGKKQDANAKMMKQLLSMMSKEQMEGYLKGLCKDDGHGQRNGEVADDTKNG